MALMLRILALSPGGIGDQILFFPTLTSIKAAYPGVELHVLVEPRSAGAYELCPEVSRVLTFNFKGNPSLAEWVDLVGTMRERNYEAIISVGSSPGVAFLLWLTGIRRRVGYAGSALSEALLTHPVLLRRDQYAAAMYHDLVKGLGIDLPFAPPTVTIRPDDQTWATQQLKTTHLIPGNFLLLHPGASQLARQKGIAKLYPANRWAEVLKTLQKQKPGLTLAVVGGPDDTDLIQALKTQLGDKITFINPPSVGKLAGLIAQSALLLCVDSAPMHLAVTTARPLVALFGPTNPQLLLPLDDKFLSLVGKTVEAIVPNEIVKAVVQQINLADA